MAVSTVPALWGWRSFQVMSGSMEPTIPLGSVVVTKPVLVGNVQVGDIISFAKRDQPETVITHRVVDVTVNDAGPEISTQGDANFAIDSWNVNNEDYVSKVVYHVPVAGYVIAFASTNLAKGVLGALILVLFVGQAWQSRRKRRDPPQPTAS